MRKLLFSFIAFLIFLTPAAFAQRGNRGNNGSQRGGGERHVQSREPREHSQHVQQHRDEYRAPRGPRVSNDRDRHDRDRGEHRGWFGHDRDRERRDHWDGHRFDNDYYNDHFGRGHGFYWYHCRWRGPRFFVGSSFYYGGGWFVIVDQVPDYWGDEVIYVEEIDGVYYLINPLYPGQQFVVNVVF